MSGSREWRSSQNAGQSYKGGVLFIRFRNKNYGSPAHTVIAEIEMRPAASRRSRYVRRRIAFVAGKRKPRISSGNGHDE